MVTLAALAGHPIVRQRYPILAEAAGTCEILDTCNIATLGGNLLQRPRCWYFRSAAFLCLRKGGQHCFALLGDNRYHAIFDNLPCAIVHPSSAAIPLSHSARISNLPMRRAMSAGCRWKIFLCLWGATFIAQMI